MNKNRETLTKIYSMILEKSNSDFNGNVKQLKGLLKNPSPKVRKAAYEKLKAAGYFAVEIKVRKNGEKNPCRRMNDKTINPLQKFN